jgi:hypothetical protein
MTFLVSIPTDLLQFSVDRQKKFFETFGMKGRNGDPAILPANGLSYPGTELIFFIEDP